MSSKALRVALLSFSLMSPSDLNSAWISSQMTHPGGQAWKLLSPPSPHYQLGKQAHPQRSSSKHSQDVQSYSVTADAQLQPLKQV